MKAVRPWLSVIISAAPLAAVAYFIRIPATSVYIFDAISVALLFSGIVAVRTARLKIPLAILYVFCVAAVAGVARSAWGGLEVRPEQFWSGIMRYGQMFLITMVVVVAARDQTVDRFRWRGPAFILSIVVPLAYALLTLAYDPESVMVFGRLAGYFTSPNYMGAFVCISIPPTFLYIATLPGFRRMMAVGLMLALFGAALFFAGSNSGWVLSSVSLALTMIAIKGFGLRSLVLLAGSVGVLVFAGNAAESAMLDSRVKGVRNTGNLLSTVTGGGEIADLGSGRGRQSLAAETWRVFFDSPGNMITGVGLGQSPVYVGKVIGHNVTAHNSVLVLLTETGVVGFVAFSALFGWILWTAGLTPSNIAVVAGYWLAMQGTPHVYLPFLWGSMTFGLFVLSNGGVDAKSATPAPIHYKRRLRRVE